MATHQAKSAELRKQVRTRLAELRGVESNSIPYPRSNTQLSEYTNEIQHLEASPQAKSAEFRQVRTRLAELEEVDPSSIPYPRSNNELSEYIDEIRYLDATPQERSAELRKQVRTRLAELRGVESNSIPYPRSNIQLSEYTNEIRHLEASPQAKSTEFRQQVRTRLAELEEVVDPSSIPYPRSNNELSEYIDEIRYLDATPQERSAELRKQVRTRLAELRGVEPNSIPYPRSNIQLSEYTNEIRHLEASPQAKSTEFRQKVRTRLAELEETDLSTIPYPRSNNELSEYIDEIRYLEATPQERSAELRKQVRTRLAELKGVEPSSISYPRSNDELSEYIDEVQHLEAAAELKKQKVNTRLTEIKGINPSPQSPQSDTEIVGCTEIQGLGIAKLAEKLNNFISRAVIYELSDGDEVQDQCRLDDAKTAITDSNEPLHRRQIMVESNVKTKQTKKNYSVSRSNVMAIVDISYREDKGGKSALWDHYTFQRITGYPTRVVGTTNNALLLKNAIYDRPFGLPISPISSTNSYKPTPPIIGLHPYSPNDLHGLLLIPGSHSDIHECPNYKDRMKNEENLIKDAWNKGRPVLGICDGALNIWKLFGGKEVKVHGHSYRGGMMRLNDEGKVTHNTKLHRLQIRSGSILEGAMYGKATNNRVHPDPVTNSVHNKAMSPSVIPPNMKIAALSSESIDKSSAEENVIEAAETCHGAPMLFIQWHPEGFNANESDGKYHRSILTYMAKAGDAYYLKQKTLLELKKHYNK